MANSQVKEKNSQVSFQDTTLAYLLSLDLNYYINKPVDSILSVLPDNFTFRKIAGWGNAWYARVLFVRYADSSLIAIFVKEFTHMDRYSSTMTWDLDLFKKELVYCITLLHKGKLLKPNEECDPYD